MLRQRWSLFTLILLLACCTPLETPAPAVDTATPVPAATHTQVPPPSPTTRVDQAEPTEPPPEPTEAPAMPAEPTQPVVVSYEGLPLPNERGEFFSASGACALCHTRMEDQDGNDVSIDSYWRSTMMANSARDPYWQATVRREVLNAPAYREIIEDKCATCHTPMTRTTDAAGETPAQLLEAGYLNKEHPTHTLALDGISCTLCHQIEDTELGQTASYSGRYVIDTESPAGERINYGPLPVSVENANLMRLSSGFTPVQSDHIKVAALCATCHTLYTPYLDAQGEIAGEFPEQTPYLEWVFSDYRREGQSCQTCHMPPAEGAVSLSVTGSEPQAPFSKHNFVGGNVFMLNILRTFAEERAVTAATEHFDATISRVQDQLKNRTATLSLENPKIVQNDLWVEAVVTNLTGHKFPTGFPSRRAWLHLAVTDAAGNVIFESGAAAADGSIVGNNNDTNPDDYELHYAMITSSDWVQIYEAIMEDTEGEVTTTLLRGSGYLKDNRLLPAGFDTENHHADIAIHGEAVADEDFLGGSDRTFYRIDLGDSAGPYTVNAELLYQTVGYRWAQNLTDSPSDEAADFLRYYATVPNTPVMVSSATIQAP